MTNHDENEPRGGLEIQLATELVEEAWAEGVSLVGPDGLLTGITKTALQASRVAEMPSTWAIPPGRSARTWPRSTRSKCRVT